MHTHHTLTRLIAGVLLSSGVATAGIALAAGAAHAQPGPAPRVHWWPPSTVEPGMG
ncbi:hypothetical protein MMAN_24210 [Mycobacterium mantenii]|uniref:Uncharacterized protein n=1 Tax=Mycobacterium mantenii TaxID=560555 RepID=A0ABM7JRV8_MYCNT|nr:hypothetical protein [Mycobacterium mantenii]MCV7243388.1 hypothetical protein [Mycobacterium mantenii]BBY38287.1 hypothetical protein MMAN_24210 [Mycobacterium mantenii]